MSHLGIRDDGPGQPPWCRGNATAVPATSITGAESFMPSKPCEIFRASESNWAHNRSAILYAPSGTLQLPITLHSTVQFAWPEVRGIRRVTATFAIWSYSGYSRILSMTKVTNSASVFFSLVPMPHVLLGLESLACPLHPEMSI